MQKVNIGIVGGAGYTGGELLRVLLRHPNAHITFVHSTSSAGELVSKVHADLVGDTDIKFAADLDQNIDVLFLCVGHGDAKKFLAANEINAGIKIIDLSQDFRLKATAASGDKQFVYGLPELQKEKIKEVHEHLFVTDAKLRLPLCADERSIVYEKAGECSIYHLALENDDELMNYGIYANGLLVESCSKIYLENYNLSQLTLI